MMLQRPSLGDWADPSCTPGEPGCVPHWYCYIPFMATPDCLASFAEGTKEIVSGGASAAGGVVGATAKGVASGVVDAATTSSGTSLLGMGLLLGAGLFTLVLFTRKK